VLGGLGVGGGEGKVHDMRVMLCCYRGWSSGGGIARIGERILGG
jgi:hypothetical protein